MTHDVSNNLNRKKLSAEKRMSIEHERITTAYHESGHTICALSNYIMIYSIAIFFNKNSKKKDLGFTHCEYLDYTEEKYSDELVRAVIESEIIMNYGGLAAEKLLYKDICGNSKIPMVMKYGSHYDTDKIAELISKYNLVPPGKIRSLYKKRLLSETQDLLEDLWLDVKLISHALIDRKKLFTYDLKEILTTDSENKTYWKSKFKDLENLYYKPNTCDADYLAKCLLK
jgi:hypothetical protein